MNRPDAIYQSLPGAPQRRRISQGGGPEGAAAPAVQGRCRRGAKPSSDWGEVSEGGKALLFDCNRIRRLRRRGGSFSAMRKTFLTRARGREAGVASRPASERKPRLDGLAIRTTLIRGSSGRRRWSRPCRRGRTAPRNARRRWSPSGSPGQCRAECRSADGR